MNLRVSLHSTRTTLRFNFFMSGFFLINHMAIVTKIEVRQFFKNLSAGGDDDADNDDIVMIQ